MVAAGVAFMVTRFGAGVGAAAEGLGAGVCVGLDITGAQTSEQRPSSR